MTEEAELLERLDVAYQRKDRKREEVYYTDTARQHAKEQLADREAELINGDLVVGTNDKTRSASIRKLTETERFVQTQAANEHSKVVMEYNQAADKVHWLRDMLDFERREKGTR